MLDPTLLDEKFITIIKNIPDAVPDGIIEINSQIIKSFGLNLDTSSKKSNVQSYFYVIEALDKITLINEQFIVWLYPYINGDTCRETITFIARHDLPHFQLELAYSTKDQFNHPAIVLDILECFIHEIRENEIICESMVRDVI